MRKTSRITCQILLAAIFLLILIPPAICAELWASKNSKKYHFPTCTWAQKIKPYNLIIFNSPEEAVKAKYIPCKVCRPPASSKTEESTSENIKPPQDKRGDIKHCYCPFVIDGDAIVVDMNGKEERVRLIGVDTPETVHPQKPVERFGKEASDFTKRMVAGKKVRLEYDWQTRDKYGRLLAYVYLKDGTFLNAEIVKQGYGFAYTKYPFKHMEEFRQYEREAREAQKGLWKENN